MFEHGGTYLKRVFGSWGKAISGPVFGGIALIVIIVQIALTDTPKVNLALKWVSWITVGFAVLFVLIAQFHVWREEHTARIDLDEKLNAAADIRGPIWIQFSAQSPFADQTIPGSALGYTFDCSNHGKAPCEINKIITKIAPPDGHAFNIIQDLREPELVEPARAFKYADTCSVRGVSVEDLRKSKVTVCAVDSLGKEYQSTETKITNLVLQIRAPHKAPQIRLAMRDREY